MKRISIAALIIVALAATAAWGAAPTVKLSSTSLGRILTTGKGYTVYMFSADRRNHDACVAKSGCVGTWPPLTVKSKPVAGAGVSAKNLGTIKLPNGSRQVTYFGRPLYRYTGDSPGTTDYVGVNQFGGTWDALSASGKRVH
jgi:predicted lipoprotein with Yx(FWY)xxD motif